MNFGYVESFSSRDHQNSLSWYQITKQQSMPLECSPHVHMNHSTMICERCQGQRLSIVPTRHVLVGILWRDIHQPQYGRIVQVLNYYEGIFQLLQLLPYNEQSISIETKLSLQQILLNPSHFDWVKRFQPRKLHAVIKSFQQVQFTLLHFETVRISKLISRNAGTPPINFGNIEHLYNSIRDQGSRSFRDYIFSLFLSPGLGCGHCSNLIILGLALLISFNLFMV